jgi:hypothetical protein
MNLKLEGGSKGTLVVRNGVSFLNMLANELSFATSFYDDGKAKNESYLPPLSIL